LWRAVRGVWGEEAFIDALAVPDCHRRGCVRRCFVEVAGREVRDREQIGHIFPVLGAIASREILERLLPTRGIRGGIVMPEEERFCGGRRLSLLELGPHIRAGSGFELLKLKQQLWKIYITNRMNNWN
jgi:hypothetical protein